jgi:plastocyanin
MRLPYKLITAALVAAIALVIAFVMIGNNGLAADRAPGRLETFVARRLVVLSIPASARAMTGAAADGAGTRATSDGADRFAAHCASCHGSDGRGRTEIGPRMYPPVPDLASPEIQSMSDGALFSIIQHGVSWTGMPAFRSTQSSDDTWTLVAFIRHLPPPTAQQMRAPATASDAKTIAMDGTTFTPNDLTVKVGETVTWINKDPFPHNVSSKAGGFASGDMDPDRQWQFHPTTAGAFPYVCTLHPGMQGTLHVTP